MNLLITGICGFVGSCLARSLAGRPGIASITGIDNLCRDGSQANEAPLRQLGIDLRIADIRDPSAFDGLPAIDLVLDAAAQPSVLAGVDGKTSSLELVQHNLYGTINILEFCKRAGAGFILLSTSRVYSIEPLARLNTEVRGERFEVRDEDIPELTPNGITEDFSTAPPVSLYGATKVASELMALEYGETFGFPVWINRCGVMAGAGQFGHPQQGIFSFWIHSWMHRRPLKYIGFGGNGFQVRDCLHPEDLVPVLLKQMNRECTTSRKIFNFAGGRAHSMSLAELSAWCAQRFGPHPVERSEEIRPFDLPWVVLDPARATRELGFEITRKLESVLEEIAVFAEQNPNWLDLSLGRKS